MDFPERLKAVIKKTGLKREGFAERIGVSRRQLFNYLGNSSEPTLSFFQRIKLEFPWVDLEWLTVGSAGSYTIASGEIPIVSAPHHGMQNPVVSKIDLMLEGMDEEAQRDVLKYTEEKKLLAECLKERAHKKAA